MSKKFWTVQIAYGAALIMAAATGSVVGMAGQAHAKAAPAKAAPKPRIAAANAAAAVAKPPVKGGVTLTSSAMIERVIADAKGGQKTVLKSPTQSVVVPGDKVMFTLNYANLGSEPAAGFRATNPMPNAVQFSAASEDWAEVSVDGGQAWGKLDTLKVNVAGTATTPATTRAATPEDVTHVRWVFAQPIAPGAKGSVSYRGVVK